MVILPGSKHVAADSAWLRDRGLDDAVRDAAADGRRVLGICGGAMLLGRSILDPDGVEGATTGIGLLPIDTVMHPAKVTQHVTLTFPRLPAAWAAWDDMTVDGYEIRNGRVTATQPGLAGDDTSVWASGAVLATTVHGVLEHPAMLAALFGRRPPPVSSTTPATCSPTPSTSTSTPSTSGHSSTSDDRHPWGVAAAAGWALDQVLGEPPARLHPVVWYGTTMRRLESLDHRAPTSRRPAPRRGRQPRDRRRQRARATRGTARRHRARRLRVDRRADAVTEATAVLAAVDDSRLDLARARLPTLVGRDVADLRETEIVRAVIESVAENTVDAVTAPLIWAAIGGAPAVLCHRAINTLDAIVGHRNPRYQRFGWASARADDVVNWLPARITTLTVTMLRPAQTGAVLTTVRRNAARHPIPQRRCDRSRLRRRPRRPPRRDQPLRRLGRRTARVATGRHQPSTTDAGRSASPALGAVIAAAIAVASSAPPRLDTPRPARGRAAVVAAATATASEDFPRQLAGLLHPGGELSFIEWSSSWMSR